MITLQLIFIIGWQYWSYLHEPKVLEVLPVTYFIDEPVIARNFPEPARIVFNKPISLDEYDVRIKPEASITASVTYVHLKKDNVENQKNKFPALSISLSAPLVENTQYTIDVHNKTLNIFKLLLQKPVRITFSTTYELLPEETIKTYNPL